MYFHRAWPSGSYSRNYFFSAIQTMMEAMEGLLPTIFRWCRAVATIAPWTSNGNGKAVHWKHAAEAGTTLNGVQAETTNCCGKGRGGRGSSQKCTGTATHTSTNEAALKVIIFSINLRLWFLTAPCLQKLWSHINPDQSEAESPVRLHPGTSASSIDLWDTPASQ